MNTSLQEIQVAKQYDLDTAKRNINLALCMTVETQGSLMSRNLWMLFLYVLSYLF